MRATGVPLGPRIALSFASFPAVAQSDTQPPSLTAFDFNPKNVEVTSGSSAVTCGQRGHAEGQRASVSLSFQDLDAS